MNFFFYKDKILSLYIYRNVSLIDWPIAIQISLCPEFLRDYYKFLALDQLKHHFICYPAHYSSKPLRSNSGCSKRALQKILNPEKR
jgi:hypothetical protein